MEFGIFFGLNLVTFLLSYFASQLPLMIQIQDKYMKQLSAVSGGLLVGTALLIVIPEGVDALYQNCSSLPAESADAAVTSTSKSRVVNNNNNNNNNNRQQSSQSTNRTQLANLNPNNNDDVSLQRRDSDGMDNHEHDEHNHSGDHQDNKSFTVGISLLIGFAVMFIVDQSTSHEHHHHHHHHSEDINRNRSQISLVNKRSLNNGYKEVDDDNQGLELADVISVSSQRQHQQTQHLHVDHKMNPSSMMIGMLIHCASDGIAMGVSTLSDSDQLTFVIFLAILLHKAPSAFALTAILMDKYQLGRRRIKQWMLLFTAMPSLSCMVTFIVLQLYQSIRLQSISTKNYGDRYSASCMSNLTGSLLLVSGGSFLYVSCVHILPEIFTNDHSDGVITSAADIQQNNSINNINQRTRQSKWWNIILVLIGMFVPIILSGGHSH
ncbi:hypothetical protein MIR68_011946 [Amoeboaphelidium protococcarum]|nr:hypothetical protein MIR68_011946 [Amoeboaphelidium protococcarum]